MRLVAPAVVAVLCLFASIVHAHTLPLSHLTLSIGDRGIDAVLEAPAVDFAHDLPDVTPGMLLARTGLDRQKARLVAMLATRLVLEADGEPLEATLLDAEPLVERQAVRLRLFFAGSGTTARLAIRGRLFPYDPRHKTFVDIYRGRSLERQSALDVDTTRIDDVATAPQGTLAVVEQFAVEGVHHIFIGPDHILFIVGLLLLGGTLPQLLKIVTAFTVAHSVTLALATLDILTPPARVIEPTIAFSIVFVGMHSLSSVAVGKRDLRLAFAFCFGLIHGFGFANVLREMELPRAALGWSLLSFNVGVEIGQACIVLTVAPLLALLKRRSVVVARKVVTAASFCVIATGTFWFVDRLVPA